MSPAQEPAFSIPNRLNQTRLDNICINRNKWLLKKVSTSDYQTVKRVSDKLKAIRSDHHFGSDIYYLQESIPLKGVHPFRETLFENHLIGNTERRNLV